MARVLFLLEVIVVIFLAPLVPNFPQTMYVSGLVYLALVIFLPILAVVCVWPFKKVYMAMHDAFGYKRLGVRSKASAKVWQTILSVFPWTSLSAIALSLARGFESANSVTLLCIITALWCVLGFTVFSILGEVVSGLHKSKIGLDAQEFSLDFAESYKLTGREIEVCQLLVRGLSYREIADRLFISTSTAKTHVLHIYEKTGVSSKGELERSMRDYFE